MKISLEISKKMFSNMVSFKKTNLVEKFRILTELNSIKRLCKKMIRVS